MEGSEPRWLLLVNGPRRQLFSNATDSLNVPVLACHQPFLTHSSLDHELNPCEMVT
jgi:hypothetical protein